MYTERQSSEKVSFRVEECAHNTTGNVYTTMAMIGGTSQLKERNNHMNACIHSFMLTLLQRFMNEPMVGILMHILAAPFLKQLHFLQHKAHLVDLLKPNI